MTRETDIQKFIENHLRPIDDIMFTRMAEDREFLEELLQVILNEPKLSIVKNAPQQKLTNMAGRSIILDVLCKLSDNRLVNIEIQKSDNTDHQKRIRYHASLITTSYTPPNTKFENIPDIWLIYISEFDIFGDNKSLYQVDRVIKQTGKIVDNGLKEFYVYTKANDGSKISRLMEVLSTTDIYFNDFPKTSNRKHQLLNDAKEKNNMNAALQELIDKEKAELTNQISILENKNTMLEDNISELKNTIEAMKQTIAALEAKLAN